MDHPIVGYTFSADNYCPSCIVSIYTSHRRYPTCFLPIGDTVEQQLDVLALLADIDRTDEYSYDSSDFPKPIPKKMVDNAISHVYCGRCFNRL
jgi:hypothetical protein